MTVLAFMQNMWVRDPERVRLLIARYGEPYRRKLVHYALFAGCHSGRRLQLVFGQETCKAINWEEASPEVMGDPKAAPPADPAHMKRAIEHYQPQLIIAFGAIAREGLRPIWHGPLLVTCHPAARHPEASFELQQAALALRAYVSQLGVNRGTPGAQA